MVFSYLPRFFIIILICSFKVAAQKDSLYVAQLLDSALRNPTQSSTILRKIDQIEKKTEPQTVASIWLLKSKFYIRTGSFQEAQKLVKKGSVRFKNNPKLTADFISLQGSIYATQREFQQAIAYYKDALRVYEELKLQRETAFINNNIANVFFNLNDFHSANQYAKKSFDVIYQLNDTVYYPQIAAILAISESKIGQIAHAKKHAKIAISAGITYKLPLAVIAGTLAEAEISFIEENWKKSIKQFQEVVQLAVTYRLTNFETYGRIGLLKTYNKLGSYDMATTEGKLVIELNNRMNLHYADYTVYQQFSEALYHTGNTDQAYIYLKQANEMYREYSSLENKKAIQELLKKYESEKKERELSRKELQLSRAINWVLILSFTVIVFAFGLIWYRRRQKNRAEKWLLQAEKNELEAFIEGEQRERERLAADIHDGIASTLTGLALQLRNAENTQGLSMLSENIDNLRQEVRLISKNIQPFNLEKEGWNTCFSRYIKTCETGNFHIHFIPNYPEKLLSNQRGLVLYRILQELIQNTIKHANATECEISIFDDAKQLCIHYVDNGIGVEQNRLENGNGWQSILKRLAAIQATYDITQTPIKGFNISIFLGK